MLLFLLKSVLVRMSQRLLLFTLLAECQRSAMNAIEPNALHFFITRAAAK